MKILRLANVPAIYFNFDIVNKKNKSLNCEELVNFCIKMGGLVPGNFTPAMQKLGHDSTDFLIHESFLKKWCKEHKTEYLGYVKTIKKVIGFYKPDVIYIERCSWALPSVEIRNEIKKEFPFVKAIVIWIGVLPHEGIESYLGFDIIFSITPKMTEAYLPACKNTFCVRSSLDLIPNKELTLTTPLKQKKYPLTFLGSSGHGMWEHTNRFQNLKFLLKNSPLQAWVNEPLAFKDKKFHSEQFYAKWFSLSYEKLLKSADLAKYKNVKSYALRYMSGESFESIMNTSRIQPPLKYQFKKNIHAPLYGKEYFQVLSESQITVNLHQDFLGYGGNFRVFEVAKAATCLLTDRAEYMEDLLDVEKDIVGFKTPQEALEKFNYLQSKPDLCNEIGENLRKKFYSKHTIYHRCQEMIGHINRFLEENG